MTTALLLVLASGAFAQIPTLTGDVPGVASPEILGEVWRHVRDLAGGAKDLPPPRLHFAPFDRRKQDADWTRWQAQWAKSHPQVYEDWLCRYSGQTKFPEARALCEQPAALKIWFDGHPEIFDEYPFPAVFRAFHYDGTDHIQLSPSATFTGTLLQGIRMSDLGAGYYAAGHEMLHYVLDSRGVPGPIHHCLFVKPRGAEPAYVDALVEFLISRGHAHFLMRKMGPDGERALDPCALRAAEPAPGPG